MDTPTLDVNAYDAWSYLSSLGLSVASSTQINWMNQNISITPELRAHWLHEFNPDLDNFSYIVGGNSYTFGVRSRDEDLLKLGFGLDFLSWKSNSAKFELDYDGLFSSSYSEHIFSGKFSIHF